LKEFLEFIAKNLVDHLEEVSIVQRETPEAIELEIKVSKDDLG